MLRYFCWEWTKSRGDKYDFWGSSTYFFETSPEGKVLRELQIYEDGNVLKYDDAHSIDIFGQMADALNEIDQFANFEISSHAFNDAWDRSTPTNK